MQMLAIDLGKQSFHIYGITGDGEVVSRKVSRAKLPDAVTKLQPQSVAMEACASSHHWGRVFEGQGYTVHLIHPRFVKPFVKDRRMMRSMPKPFSKLPIGRRCGSCR